MALSKEDILLGLPIEDVVQRAENNFVQVFNELEDEVGYTIGLSVDPSSYEMTLELKNSVGDTISTASVDLPIESLVLSASYDNGILTLQLQSGETLDVDISSLISGLVPDSRTINGKNLKSNVTLTQDDVGDGTSYVRFTPAEKEKLKNIATGANNYQPPTYTGLPTTKGLYKIKVNSNGDVVEATAVAKSDITALGIAGNENATPSKAGLMSATDKAKLNGIAEGANKYVLPNAGATLGGVKSGGDATIQDGVITVTSVGGKTADEIGKVKDVTVNGASVLNESTGVAAITIESLKSGYVNVNVSDSSWVDCTVNGTTYKAIKVADTDTELEVYNSAGNKILTHTVRKEKEGYLYICVGTKAISCTLRKISGNSVGTGGSSSVVKVIELKNGRGRMYNDFLGIGKLYALTLGSSPITGYSGIFWFVDGLDIGLGGILNQSVPIGDARYLSFVKDQYGNYDVYYKDTDHSTIEMNGKIYLREIGPSLLPTA